MFNVDNEFALLKKLINTQIKKPKDFDLYVYFMRSFEHNLIKIGISEPVYLLIEDFLMFRNLTHCMKMGSSVMSIYLYGFSGGI